MKNRKYKGLEVYQGTQRCLFGLRLEASVDRDRTVQALF